MTVGPEDLEAAATADLGNDPDGDLDGYDGPADCTCGPWAQNGRSLRCPVHAEQNAAVLGAARCSRCMLFGYIDAESGWCQECLWGVS